MNKVTEVYVPFYVRTWRPRGFLVASVARHVSSHSELNITVNISNGSFLSWTGNHSSWQVWHPKTTCEILLALFLHLSSSGGRKNQGLLIPETSLSPLSDRKSEGQTVYRRWKWRIFSLRPQKERRQCQGGRKKNDNRCSTHFNTIKFQQLNPLYALFLLLYVDKNTVVPKYLFLTRHVEMIITN